MSNNNTNNSRVPIPQHTQKLGMASWSKPTVVDLRRERRQANFDRFEMSSAIYGGEENLAMVEKQVRLVSQEPRLQTDDLWWMGRTQRYYRACERARIFVNLVRDNNIPFEERGPLEILLGEDLFILLHDIMFLPSLMNLADDEQKSWWLQKALDYKLIGTYAQTEITHGSNVRGLGTTATFDEKLYGGDGGWIVNTPNLESSKWWPGGLGKSCNCVILMARVIIKGKDYGPHPFFFQVRDWETHASLPGIKLLDIGQKLGYNGMDNGYMRISNVKIPRRNLLMKYTVVDKDGNYKKQGNEKMLFGIMTYTRMKISLGSGIHLAKACITACRYSAVRRQFAMQRVQMGSDQIEDTKSGSSSSSSSSSIPPTVTSNDAVSQLSLITKNSKKTETQVLNYTSQQYLIFPQLALAFAMHFTSQACETLYNQKILEFRNNIFDSLQEMHIFTSTLKAVNTMISTDGMEQCRKSLGGHGFLNCAGIGQATMSALPTCTYEGDFVVLSIQVGTNIIGAVTKKMMKGITKVEDHKTPLLQYIYDFDPIAAAKSHKPPSIEEIQSKKLLSNHDFLIDCIKRRACYIHYSTAQTFQEEVMKRGGKPSPDAIDEVKIEFMRMTYSHAYVMYAIAFKERLEKQIRPKYPKCANILDTVFELFCLTVIDSGYDRNSGLGEFIASGALPSDRRIGSIIIGQIKKCLTIIRPQAVPLCDSWNIPDFLLNSVLGRYDGRVYESLYEAAQREPLNEFDVTDGYYDHIQYILHPEREFNGREQKRGDENDKEKSGGKRMGGAKL